MWSYNNQYLNPYKPIQISATTPLLVSLDLSKDSWRVAGKNLVAVILIDYTNFFTLHIGLVLNYKLAN